MSEIRCRPIDEKDKNHSICINNDNITKDTSENGIQKDTQI